jgi:hypothetical protein
MPINFRISALAPVGLIVESVAQLDDTILIPRGPVSRWRRVLCVHRLRGVFRASMSVRFWTCRAQVGVYPAQRAGETSGNAPLGRDRMTTRRKHLVMQAVVKPTVILRKRRQPLVGQEPS